MLYFFLYFVLTVQIWFEKASMRRTACSVLETSFETATFMECTGWQAGDRLQGAFEMERPTLKGLLVSLGSRDTIASYRFPGVLIAPASSTQVKNQYSCQHALNVQFPLTFIKYFSRSSSDVVADFMCGSGSCAVAAAYFGRSSISVDIESTMVLSAFIDILLLHSFVDLHSISVIRFAQFC